MLEGFASKQAKPVGPKTLIGMILNVQGKPDEARKAFEEVLLIDPNAVIAANNLAWYYAERGENLDEALELAQRAKARAIDEAFASDTLGWVYYKKDLASLAVAALREAVQHEPQVPDFHYRLGLAYLKNGDNRAARESLQHALKLSSSFRGAEDAKRALAGIPG
jgi:Tfp pilus assembly protein PilF